MKRRIPILSTASVFFIVLILLVSCGIGIPFNISSSITNKSDDITLSPDQVLAKYTIPTDSITIDNLELIKKGSGPSLMLFYTVTDSQERINFENAFSLTYKKSFNGININSDEVLTVNDYTLYRFSDSQNSRFQAPYYIATADTPTSPEFSCTLTKTTSVDDVSMVDMNLSFVSGSYTINNSSILRRYTGDSFETTTANIRNPSFPDYHIGDEHSLMYIHIYAAVNISEGNFYNIYWTDLVHLGYITL
jgi:hypothetical protein